MSDEAAPVVIPGPAELSRVLGPVLDGWDIPNVVPPRVSGGVIPRPDPSYPHLTNIESTLSPLARTLTAIVERVGRGTFLFLGDHPHPNSAALLPAPTAGRFGAPHSETLLRLSAESSDFVLHSDSLPAETMASWEWIFAICALVAPGWNWIPVLMPSPQNGDPIQLGSLLGERFFGDGNVVIIAVSTLTRYGAPWSFTPAGVGPTAERWVQENDARVIAYLETLSAEKILRESVAQRSASDPGSIAAAAAAARRRDGWTGHLIEYRAQANPDPVFQSGISQLGMVF